MGSEGSEPTNTRVALVTGGSRGIGAAISRRLAREGATVVVAARHVEACEKVAAEIQNAGGTARAVCLDVSAPASIAATALEVGAVDWLVNNAGIAVSAPLLSRDDDQDELFVRHMAINFHGARNVAETLLPAMKKRGYGRIVNLASSAGLRGYAYVAAYCASKHALVGYTLAAAAELAESGVTMNAVCPHYVDSPMLAQSVERIVDKTGKSRDEAREHFRQVNPGRRLIPMEEVADAVCDLLCSDANETLVELDGSPERKVLRPNEVR